MFFSKGSGNFPEFFEKSIDKQKIDAILNSAVRFCGAADEVAVRGAAMSRKQAERRRGRRPSRYKESMFFDRRERHVLLARVRERCRGTLVLFGGDL